MFVDVWKDKPSLSRSRGNPFRSLTAFCYESPYALDRRCVWASSRSAANSANETDNIVKEPINWQINVTNPSASLSVWCVVSKWCGFSDSAGVAVMCCGSLYRSGDDIADAEVVTVDRVSSWKLRHVCRLQRLRRAGDWFGYLECDDTGR